MYRTIAIPLCRDTIFPYTEKGKSLRAAKNVIQFIHTRPYLEKVISPQAIIGPVKAVEDGVDFLFKLGVIKESKSLDFLAEQLLLTVETMKEKTIKTDGNKVLVNGMKIVSLDFEAKVIKYIRKIVRTRTVSAPMPKNIWDRQVIVKGLNVKWWSILKAVAAYHFGLPFGDGKPTIKDRLFPIALEKGNIVIDSIKAPDTYKDSNMIYIIGQGGDEKIIMRENYKDKHEDEYKIRITYMEADKVYFDLGYFGEEYDFLVCSSSEVYNFINSKYYFKLGVSTGIASYYDAQVRSNDYFYYDTVQIVGDRARILLGHDIFLKVAKVEYSRGIYMLHFILFADTGRKVDGSFRPFSPEIFLRSELGKYLFERMRHI